MSAAVYVEGGGNRRALRAECRKGFSRFLARAGLAGRMPRIVACGGRQKAFNDFRHAYGGAGRPETVILLVDSEAPVAPNVAAWAHLKERDGWGKPEGAPHDSAHLMVQCMEAWFVADKDCLAAFFGQGFNRNALPRGPDIEAIPKSDLLTGLRNATRRCSPKGEYAKSRDSFAILAATDPKHVLEASPHARSLIETLLADTAE